MTSYSIERSAATRDDVAPILLEAASDAWRTSVKRTADTAMAVVLLVLCSPLLLVVMAIVRLTSRGPAIYRQARVGANGRIFTMYKIRTMIHDCERLTGPCWATESDPRVIPIGRFLRRTHLDEFPQLWNIIRGEMGLVGPRPERPELVAKLEGTIRHYRDRLAVRPGLTGLAQVYLPPDGDLASVQRKLVFDLHYIHHFGLWLDLRILLVTGAFLAGIPFSVSRKLLALPDASKAVEGAEPEPQADPQARSA